MLLLEGVVSELTEDYPLYNLSKQFPKEEKLPLPSGRGSRLFIKA